VRRRKLEEEDLLMPEIMQGAEVQQFMISLLENISQVFDLADTHDKVQPVIAELQQNAHTADLKLAQLQCDGNSEKERLAVLNDTRNIKRDLTTFELQQHRKLIKLQ